MKSLVLAEKPSIGKELARVLTCPQQHKGYYEGTRYVVTWALGHLVTLREPEEYDRKYQQWRLEDLPIMPRQMKLKVLKGKGQQLKVIKGLMQRRDIRELIIATDAGREGELVARWIMELNHWRKPFRRLWISSQTDKAILAGMAQLQDGHAYDNLAASARCRAEADWLIGLNVTRALTTKYNAQLSAGRVQSPTLAMIVAREQEIARFVPQRYWTLQAQCEDFHAVWRSPQGHNRLTDEATAQKIANQVRGQLGHVIQVQRRTKEQPPPLLYDLTELQREANRRFGFTAHKTLQVMQNLYEIHKIATYPRTDSRYLTQDIVASLPERLQAISVGPYEELVRPLLGSKLKINRRIVNDQRVHDHHAIIPTGENVPLAALNHDERKIWDLLARRFIAVFSPPWRYQVVTLTIKVGEEHFVARGTNLKQAGWRAIESATTSISASPEEEEPAQELGPLRQGDQRFVRQCQVISRLTQPPSRYTEATLLSAMEHPGSFIRDKQLRQSIEQAGLGTPATRAEIIEKLIRTQYVERQGQHLRPTAKGKQLIDLLMEELKTPALTAQWEQRLANIARGQEAPAKFMAQIRAHTQKLVQAVKASQRTYQHDNLSQVPCPQCGQRLLDVQRDQQRVLVCPQRGCGYRNVLVRISNRRCPHCHVRMEIREEKKGPMFVCARCNLRESMDAGAGKMSRREIQASLRRINQKARASTGVSAFGAQLLKALEQSPPKRPSNSVAKNSNPQN